MKKQMTEKEIMELAGRFGRQAEPPQGLAEETIARFGLGTLKPKAWKLRWILIGALPVAGALAWFLFIPARVPTTPSKASVPQNTVLMTSPKAQHGKRSEGAHQESKTAAPQDSLTEAPAPKTGPALSSAQPQVAKILPAEKPTVSTQFHQDLLVPGSPAGLSMASGGVQAVLPSSSASAAHASSAAVPATRSSAASAEMTEFPLQVRGNRLVPGHGTLKVSAFVRQSGSCTATLYSENGDPYLVLAHENRSQGVWNFAWNGMGPDGSAAASGVYTLVVATPGKSERSHVLVVR
jgi:hypothetical protein